MPSHPSILLLDDSPGECELLRQALAQTGINALLYTEQDAEAALHLLRSHSALPSLPSLILLDWHLRHQSGDRLLKRFKADPRIATIPVVVFTTSDDAGDLASAYANGANGYVVKPALFADLIQCVADICRFWLARNRIPDLVNSRC